jgi:hypothetical protein
MKATINGVNVEGTPQEIAQYIRLINEQAGVKYPNPYGPYDYQPKIGDPLPWWMTKVTCG